MKLRTFISPSVHQSFFNLLNELMKKTRTEEKNELMMDLVKEKEELEQIFYRYKTAVSEVHSLIRKYHYQEIQIRKKIRLIKRKV
jgi:hypothetical protein